MCLRRGRGRALARRGRRLDMLRRSFDGAVAPSKSIQQHRRDAQRAGACRGSTHFLGPQRLIDLAPRPRAGARRSSAQWTASREGASRGTAPRNPDTRSGGARLRAAPSAAPPAGPAGVHRGAPLRAPPSQHLQLGVQRARLLDRLKYRDQVPRRGVQRVERLHQVVDGRSPDRRQRGLGSPALICVWGVATVWPCESAGG